MAFNATSFDNASLTDFVVRAPFDGGQIAQRASGLFQAQSVDTTSVQLEFLDSATGLLTTRPATDLRTDNVSQDKRKLEPVNVSWLRSRISVLRADLIGVRGFGETGTINYDEYLGQQSLKLGNSHRTNIEYHMVNAIQGGIKDNAGNTLVNLYTLTGTTQTTQVIDWNDADTNVGALLTTARQKSRKKLGMAQVGGYMCLAGDESFREIRHHPTVKAAYDHEDVSGRFFREGNTLDTFYFNGVLFVNYPECEISGQTFVASDEAWMVPLNSDVFQVRYSVPSWPIGGAAGPVNLSMEQMDHNQGVDIRGETAVVAYCTRPDSVVKITRV